MFMFRGETLFKLKQKNILYFWDIPRHLQNWQCCYNAKLCWVC